MCEKVAVVVCLQGNPVFEGNSKAAQRSKVGGEDRAGQDNPYWLGQLSEATSITVSQQAGGSCGKADGKWTYDKQVEWQLLVERVLVGQA
ncbi:hypothetical protein ACLKA6_003422 [Drosophila palustris]